jgi:hypothetical protein
MTRSTFWSLVWYELCVQVECIAKWGLNSRALTHENGQESALDHLLQWRVSFDGQPVTIPSNSLQGLVKEPAVILAVSVANTNHQILKCVKPDVLEAGFR